ncbi:RecBCD enzyme subunit RecD [uncultured archaeon]|nr:RecBCD enzyme subunit RecD [uncultured archaeon]
MIKEKSEDEQKYFIKELTKYFVDFLETDFHKRKNPKRSIKIRNEDNLLVGLNTNKYPDFNNLIWKLINHGFNKDILNTIHKSAYKINIPKNQLLDIIKIQTDQISTKHINNIIIKASETIEKTSILHQKQFNKALSVSLEEVSTIIKDDLVIPFITNLKKPLDNLSLGDENSIYLMEEELTAVLVKTIENKISEILKLISKEKVDINKQLKTVLDIKDIKNSIVTFFENYKALDLFAEIFEMERNRNILDKQEFYLYFFDIAYKKVKYPIFYIPFNIEMQTDFLLINFDSQVYINKKALEYIAQEYNQETGKKGSLKTISDRIIYLAQHENDFGILLNNILSEIINFFELDKKIDVNNPDMQVSKNLWTKVSNSCYINIFDKSDEALLNDYEEILQLLESEDNTLANAFNKLIDDFIHKEPEPFNPVVEDEWDNMSISDRLVCSSPIPLNSEQLQILSAIKKENCKYITVQGPPGTGKSHTITAIVFDAILKNQSVLVLSDKKEALDVVEDKITETMNKVRNDKNFQNPILRLGKTGNTYSQILSPKAVDNINIHYRAIKKDYETLEQNIQKSKNTLKEDLEAEILAYSEINIEEIYELFELESYYETHEYIVDIEEVIKIPESSIELEEFRKILKSSKDNLVNCRRDTDNHDELLRVLNFSVDDFDDLTCFQEILPLKNVLPSLLAHIQNLKDTYIEKIELIHNFDSFSDGQLIKLNEFIKEYENSKTWLFGYFFKGDALKKLDTDFKKTFLNSKFEQPHKNINELKAIYEIYNSIINLKKQSYPPLKFDYLYVTHKLLQNESTIISLQKIIKFSEDINFLKNNLEKYPNTFAKINLNLSSLETFHDNLLIKMTDSDFNRLIRYINIKQKIIKNFANLPTLNYAEQKQNIEDLVTSQMTYLLDGTLINFYQYNKNTAKTLREIIRSKQKFPKDEFAKLKNAFPCILAGIRDYAEYIPLEPEIFDLVIIDEASQVSIAQAFPALLRAKKIVILGDKKQFSNVKSAQARSDTNREYRNNLKDVFKKHVSEETIKLVKLEKFDIKTSILEFFESIHNYNTQLSKYFRGYKEIISYSNKNFYQDSLQVMKIRGKAIDEVIKFSYIKHDGKAEMSPNTNVPEIEYIITKLKEFKDKNSNLSVGIITPHTNQQKLIVEMIHKLPEKDYYFDKLHLKIMTFDTCQGEERDIILYSMVATIESDQLWGVFIKDLKSVDIEEDGQIKAQRLNVGFSRAKECMHFILSKPIDKYTGSIGEALRNYYYVLEEAKKEKGISQVDQKSKMEPEVLNWFYQTDFWKKYKDHIEFNPQFEIGKYLRQLDKTYNHPNYKVDFLLIYEDETHREHKIIIEYDGFREHFKEADEINKFNHQDYYSDEDIYRQKVLESYSYKFLRINKFNIGTNPILTLDERIRKLIKNENKSNELLNKFHNRIEGLQNGELKECPKCKEIRNYDDFRDISLLSGYGRFCRYCKGITNTDIAKSAKSDKIIDSSGSKICPRCSSKMILRNGRYGKFYGCSKFPYCKGTISYQQ